MYKTGRALAQRKQIKIGENIYKQEVVIKGERNREKESPESSARPELTS